MDNHNDGVGSFLSAWTAVERDGDTSARERMLEDDFAGIGPLGFQLSKQDRLARRAEGAPRGNPIPSDLRATLILTGSPAQRRGGDRRG